jgi:hypothetical protein
LTSLEVKELELMRLINLIQHKFGDVSAVKPIVLKDIVNVSLEVKNAQPIANAKFVTIKDPQISRKRLNITEQLSQNNYYILIIMY